MMTKRYSLVFRRIAPFLLAAQFAANAPAVTIDLYEGACKETRFFKEKQMTEKKSSVFAVYDNANTRRTHDYTGLRPLVTPVMPIDLMVEEI